MTAFVQPGREFYKLLNNVKENVYAQNILFEGLYKYIFQYLDIIEDRQSVCKEIMCFLQQQRQQLLR